MTFYFQMTSLSQRCRDINFVDGLPPSHSLEIETRIYCEGGFDMASPIMPSIEHSVQVGKDDLSREDHPCVQFGRRHDGSTARMQV